MSDAAVVHGGLQAAELEALGIAPTSVLDLSASLNPRGPHASVLLAAANADLRRYPPSLRRATARRPRRARWPRGGTGAGHAGRDRGDPPRSAGAARTGDGVPDLPADVRRVRGCRAERTGARVLEGAGRRAPRRSRSCAIPTTPPGSTSGGGRPSEVLVAASVEGGTLLLDVAYDPFVEGAWDADDLVRAGASALVVHSMTKLHAIPGVRLGYVTGPAATRRAATRAAVLVGGVEYGDRGRASRRCGVEEQQRWATPEVTRSRDELTVGPARGRHRGARLARELRAGAGRRCAGVPPAPAATRLRGARLHLVRAARVGARGRAPGRRAASASGGRFIEAYARTRRRERAAPVLMVVGTASSVGKSVLVTALCRIFAQDGVRVAPFKAQNMSNNADVTPDGLEIGRAQSEQAAAAGLAPTVEMNPVLLKPQGDRTSQVVVDGRPAGVLHSRDFIERKRDLWPHVERALASLRARLRAGGRRGRGQRRGAEPARGRHREHARGAARERRHAARRRHRPRRRVRAPARHAGVHAARGARAGARLRDQPLPRRPLAADAGDRGPRSAAPACRCSAWCRGSTTCASRRRTPSRSSGPSARERRERACDGRHRGRAPAAHRQLRRLRPAGRRAGRAPALRHRRPEDLGTPDADRAPRHEGDDRRPRGAARGAGSRTRSSRTARDGTRGARRVRRLPDARRAHRGPRSAARRQRAPRWPASGCCRSSTTFAAEKVTARAGRSRARLRRGRGRARRASPSRATRSTWAAPSTRRRRMASRRCSTLDGQPDGAVSDAAASPGRYLHGLFHNDALRRALLHGPRAAGRAGRARTSTASASSTAWRSTCARTSTSSAGARAGWACARRRARVSAGG